MDSASPEPALVRYLGVALTGLNRVTLGVAALGLLLAFGLICWSVLMRYFMNQPQVWVDEVVGFLLIIIVTCTAAEVLQRGQHIAVDILVERLSGKAQRLAQAWSALAVVWVALIFIVNGAQSAQLSKALDIVMEGHLEWPQYGFMVLIPFCGVLLLLTSLETLMRLYYGLPLKTEHKPLEDEL